jgi:hypothetical protein
MPIGDLASTYILRAVVLLDTLPSPHLPLLPKKSEKADRGSVLIDTSCLAPTIVVSLHV